MSFLVADVQPCKMDADYFFLFICKNKKNLRGWGYGGFYKRYEKLADWTQNKDLMRLAAKKVIIFLFFFAPPPLKFNSKLI